MIAPAPADWLEADPAELQPAYPEFAEADAPPADEPAASTEPAEAQCPHCGELLAWHDEFSTCAASVTVAPTLAPAPAAPHAEFSQDDEPGGRPPLLWRPGPRANFAYELGHRVQPMPAEPARIIWRGQLKERHPDTGLVHRVNVYRLNDGYWDCYREEELQAA